MNRFISFLLVAGVLLAGCVDDKPAAENVLARFEGGTLTSEDVEAHYRDLKKQTRFRNNPELLTPEFVFDHALNMEMIIAEGLKKELHHDAYIRQELHSHMSNLFLKILEDDLIEKIDKESISEEEMRRFYEEHKENYQKKTLYSLLAFEVDPNRAGEAMEKLNRGALKFGEAAAHYGQNEKERENGGKTGKRSLRRFQPAWRPVVQSLETGKPAGPVEISGKHYIMLLENKTEPYQFSFEEKKAYIRNDVLYNRYRDAWQKVYDRLRQEFRVQLNQDALDVFYKNLSAKEEESAG